jgi:hypothetical protein
MGFIAYIIVLLFEKRIDSFFIDSRYSTGWNVDHTKEWL